MTDREQQIVKWWGEREPTEEIAAVFGCSSATIRDEVRRLRRQGVQIPMRKAVHERAGANGPRVGTPFDQMMAGTWEKVA